MEIQPEGHCLQPAMHRNPPKCYKSDKKSPFFAKITPSASTVFLNSPQGVLSMIFWFQDFFWIDKVKHIVQKYFDDQKVFKRILVLKNYRLLVFLVSKLLLYQRLMIDSCICICDNWPNWLGPEDVIYQPSEWHITLGQWKYFRIFFNLWRFKKFPRIQILYLEHLTVSLKTL